MKKNLVGIVVALHAVFAATTSSAEGVPNVATDILPVHALASQVMEGVGTPDLIIQPGVSPHGYALRPSEAEALQRADLVFFISSDMTPWLDRALESLAFDTERLELQLIPGGVTHSFRQRTVFESHEEDHDESHDDDNAHDDHGHEEHNHDDHTGLDPHAWLDPENGKLWLAAMAEKLATLDPANADTYRRNAAEGVANIDVAIAEARAALDPVRDVKYVVFHDAYQYFEHRFGLHGVGAISLSDATKPGPKRISEIRQAVAEMGVQCVFSEPQFNPGLVQTVFEGSEARTALLDPLGTKLSPGAGLYPALIRSLATEMATCLGGHE